MHKGKSCDDHVSVQLGKGEFFNPKKPFFSLEIALKHERANRVYKEMISQHTLTN